MREKIRLGDLLLREGLIDEEKLNRALAVQKERKERVGRILVELKFISEEKICEVLSTQMNIPKVNLSNREFSFFDKRLDPLIKKKGVLPLVKSNNTIVLAMSDPLDVITIDDVRRITGCEIKPVITTESQMTEAIKRYDEALMAFEIKERDSRLSQFVDAIRKNQPKPFQVDTSVFLEATKSVFTGKTRDTEVEDTLGDVLVRKGIITQSQLDMAKSQRREERLGDVLVRLKFTNRGRVLTELTQILFKI
ncbi:MAG: hypothetical protein AB1630_03385 [bacterium]